MSQYSDLEKELAALEARQHAIRQLLASPGWKEVAVLGEGAITSRRQTAFAAFNRIRGFEDCFTMANLGSEIAGIQFVLAIPAILLEDLAQTITRTRDQMKETDNG